MKHLYLIGNNIQHSFSPKIHNSLLKFVGIDDVEYSLFDVGPNNIQSAILRLNDAAVIGANVTSPYKKIVANHFGNSNPVNTIFKRDGIQTTSTDFQGCLYAIGNIVGRTVVIFGTGGVSESLRIGFEKFCSVIIVGRNNVVNLSQLRKDSDLLIINATPLGSVGFENEMIYEDFSSSDIVFDCVSNPRITKMLKTAESCGCKTISGIEMLINQAIFSFELFFDIRLDFEQAQEVSRKSLTL